MDKTVIATFCPGSTYSRCSVWQWDTGLQLCIKGLNLTDPPRVHWGRLGEYTAMELDSTLEDGVISCQIPDELIAQDVTADYTVDAWVHVVDETAGRTIRAVQMTVKSRAKPDGYVSTPTEAKTWDTVTATADEAKNVAVDAKSVADAAKNAAEGKADGLKYEDSDLSLLAGEKVLSSVHIDPGGVKSVNGKTGDVTLTASDVGAQEAGDYVNTDDYDVAMQGLWQTVDTKVSTTELEKSLAKKQDAGDYATTTELTEGLAEKADKSEIPIVWIYLVRDEEKNITYSIKEGETTKDYSFDYIDQCITAGRDVRMYVTDYTELDELYLTNYNKKIPRKEILRSNLVKYEMTVNNQTVYYYLFMGYFLPGTDIIKKIMNVYLRSNDALNGIGYAINPLSRYKVESLSLTDKTLNAYGDNDNILSAVDLSPIIPTVPESLKNPAALTIKIGSTEVTYDGSTAQSITIEDGTEVEY
jgi:hypothetical protein